MKTLLVAINAKYIHTNLAVRYLYTYCKDSCDIDFIEFTIKDNKENIINYINDFKPSILGFSCYIWNIDFIKELVYIIKQKYPQTKILLGGPEVSYDVEHYFKTLPIDFIISNEGEYSLKELLVNKKAYSKIPQLHYRLNDKIFINKKEYIIDLNTLPSPYQLIRDKKSLSNRIQYIESSRGCPYRCSYCLASLEKHVRFFKSENIKNVIAYLMHNGAKTFKFLDRTFNIRKDYALDIFEFIIKEHKLGCVFQFEITGDLLDEEIILYLNKYAPKGLIRFEIGVQSTNQTTNQLVLRNQDLIKLTNNIKLLQAGNKIDLHLDLIAGLPKEDYNSFIKTFNDVFYLKPHELQLGFLKMLRGTKIRKESKLYNYQFNNNAPYEIISNDCLTPFELKKIHYAEEMLEKYYNSHRFDYTLNYLLSYYYKDNYYQFFESLGIYWISKYELINYQLHDLCTRLLEFWTLPNKEIISSLLIFDYLKEQKTKPKRWYESRVGRKEKQEIYKQIAKNDLLNLNLDTLNRYALLEKIEINPYSYELGDFYLLKIFLKDNNNIYIFNKAQF